MTDFDFDTCKPIADYRSADIRSAYAFERIATALEQIAAHLAPPAEPITRGTQADGWFAWGGGQRPVPEDMLVDYRMRSATFVETRPAGQLAWHHDGQGDDIVAYRIARP